MSHLLRMSLVAAALFAGPTLIRAQAIDPAPSAPEMVPAPDDEGRSVGREAEPAPAMPAPEEQGTEDQGE